MNRSDLEDASNTIDEAKSLMGDLINLLDLSGRADTDDIRDAVESLLQEKIDLAERLDAILDERDERVQQVNDLVDQVDALVEERNALSEQMADND